MPDGWSAPDLRVQEIVRYLERRLARRPKGDLTDSEWRRTLMSWGHDPLA